MSIENMFGELDKIDILAETKTGEVVMVLVCNGFIDGSPETQKALLDKMEGYLNHTQSEEFQKEYGGWPVILRVTLGREPDERILALLSRSPHPRFRTRKTDRQSAGSPPHLYSEASY